MMMIAVTKSMANIGTSIVRLFPTRLFRGSFERRDGTRVHCIACAARDDLLTPLSFLGNQPAVVLAVGYDRIMMLTK
jgi:hypothetical protein